MIRRAGAVRRGGSAKVEAEIDVFELANENAFEAVVAGADLREELISASASTVVVTSSAPPVATGCCRRDGGRVAVPRCSRCSIRRASRSDRCRRRWATTTSSPCCASASSAASSTRRRSRCNGGKLGTFAPMSGQEAVVVGSVFALDRDHDWVVLQYREQLAMLHWGLELSTYFLQRQGHPRGSAPRARAPVPPAGRPRRPPAAPVGVAWGMKLKGEPSVAACYFGDGASSEGDFHESCNLAGVVKAPVIFVCQNNQWAISTPVEADRRRHRRARQPATASRSSSSTATIRWRCTR